MIKKSTKNTKESQKRRFSASVSAETLEILVYDDIGENWYGTGVTATSVTDAIKQAGSFDRISLRINSPGGDCFEGVAIYNLLRAFGKPIDTFVDGIAASAASVIAMAGDTITIGVGAMLMIHNASTFAMGDANALRKTADTLEMISTTIAGIYVLRSGQDAAAVKEMMDAETWMDATQAVEKGFATASVAETEQAKKDAARNMALAKTFNLKAFRHLPQMLLRGVRNDSINPDCQCECTACRTIGCAGCEDDPCTEPGCTCENNTADDSAANRTSTEMTAPAAPSLELYRHRLTAHQHSV